MDSNREYASPYRAFAAASDSSRSSTTWSSMNIRKQGSEKESKNWSKKDRLSRTTSMKKHPRPND